MFTGLKRKKFACHRALIVVENPTVLQQLICEKLTSLRNKLTRFIASKMNIAGCLLQAG
jgi:hypothetical protein